jgi:hypothetical protein
MATTKAKAKSKKAVATTTTKKKVNGKPRKATMTAKIATMMARPTGTTREEVLKLTGWGGVSFQQMAAAVGKKVKIDSSTRPFRYRI